MMNCRLAAMRFARFAVLLLVLITGIRPMDVRAQSAQIQLGQPGRMPVALDLHGSVVVGKRLYIIGGKNAREWSRKVWSAEIADGANLRDWREETEMPENRTHIGRLTQVANNRIYILGGLSPEVASITDPRIRAAKDVLWTTIQQDGSLAPWQKAAPFSGTPPVHGASCSDGQHLYLLGGRAGNITDVVLKSDTDAQGVPGAWVAAARMPVPLIYQGAAHMEGQIWVWGGQKSPEDRDINSEVWSATVGADGSLGAWVGRGTMPVAIYRSAYLGFNDFLVSVGGFVAEGVPTTDIWFAKLERGKLGAWTSVRTDLQSHMYHPIAIDADRGGAFISGGRAGGNDKTSKARDVIASIQGFQLPQGAESRLAIAYARPAEQTAAAGSTAGAEASVPARFFRLDDALGEAQRTGRPVLAYFYSPQVPACKRLYDALLSDPDSVRMTKRFLLAAVDSSGTESAHAYRFGIFRVPSLILLRPDGTIVDKQLGLKDWDDAKAWLSDL